VTKRTNTNNRRPRSVGLLVAALVLPLAGCHLLFPFTADQPQANDAGVADMQGDLSFDGPADGQADQRDAPAEQAQPDQAQQDQTPDQPPLDGPVPLDVLPSIDAGVTPTVVWAVASSTGTGPHTVKALDVAVDSNGNSYVTGFFNGPAQIGTLAATSKASADVFVASFDASGKPRWAKSFGDTGEDKGHRLIVDSGGSVYVCGVAKGPIKFGLLAKTVSGLSKTGDAFVAKYTSLKGTPDWLTLLQSGGSAACNDLIPAAGGGVHVVGTFSGNLKLDSSLNSAGSTDGFAATLSPAGVRTWSLRFGGAAADRGTALAQDSKGELLVGGEFHGSLPGGAASITSANMSTTDFFALRHKVGSLTTVFHMGGLGDDTLNAMKFGPGGNLYAVGQIYGSVNLGGTTWGYLNRDNGYLIKRQGMTAAWSRATKVASTSDAAELTDLEAVTSSVYVTGAFSGSLTWAGSSHKTSNAQQDILLGRYSSNGTPVWTRSFGGTGADVGRGVAAGSGNSLFLTGSFQDTVSFGGKLVSSGAGNHDMFLVKFQDQP
jgi:hypothetical protein